MKLFKYLLRFEIYLDIAGLLGLLRVISAKATNSTILLRANRSDCRFPFSLRFPSSDVPTFEQIFVHGAYDFAVESEPTVIVDAGANIGLASIYFANRYPEAQIIAIEPEEHNFALLKENVAPYANVTPLQAALWHKNEEINLVDPGRGEWGFRVEGTEVEGEPPDELRHLVRAVTVDRLMDEYGFDRIDMLKMDIEGAEKEIFSNSTPWLDRVDSLIIELHEWLRPGCNRTFYHGTDGFDLEWRQGENVVLTRGNWLRKGLNDSSYR